MPDVEGAVREQLVEAELVLRGLAIDGTDDADALRLGPAGCTPDVLAPALGAVHRQADTASAAAARALDGGAAGWLASTAPDWQRYVRWLYAVHDVLAERVEALEPLDAELLRPDAHRAGRACAAARQAWGVLPRSVPTRTELDSVVNAGRLYVSVDELTDSLRERAAAFSAAARAATAAEDDLGALVAGELATELIARADALAVAAMESDD